LASRPRLLGRAFGRFHQEVEVPIQSEQWLAGTPCWVDLGSPDLAASIAFYGKVLGWSFVDTGEEYGHYSIAQVNGHAAAAIGPKQDPGQPTAWTVYLASDDADATAAAVTANGGTVLAEPFDIPGTGRMAVAMDPAGAAFGVWQASEMIGAEIYNEPGGLTWTDARLTDPDSARDFYAAVFGYRYDPMPGAPGHYMTFRVGENPLGGIGGMMDPATPLPSHWLPYFAVEDADKASTAATSAGGTLQRPLMDSPFGRMAFLTDPDGAAFALMGAAAG
jgi:predicted enzyme related to lactoylglutathione lyase